MELNAVIASRRSIRKYKPTPVENEVLEQILEAGRAAPTARNDQDWYCAVVRNPGILSEMGTACCKQQWVGEAPAILVLCGTNNREMNCGQYTNPVDCSIVLTHMILKAAELGLGTCWLGAFEADQVRALLNIPETDTIVAVTPLGYADDVPQPRPRKDLNLFVRYID